MRHAVEQHTNDVDREMFLASAVIPDNASRPCLCSPTGLSAGNSMGPSMETPTNAQTCRLKNRKLMPGVEMSADISGHGMWWNVEMEK